MQKKPVDLNSAAMSCKGYVTTHTTVTNEKIKATPLRTLELTPIFA